MIKEFVNRITEEQFNDERPLVIGTGGFANLFSRERIFDEVVSDLILIGLKEINSTFSQSGNIGFLNPNILINGVSL